MFRIKDVAFGQVMPLMMTATNIMSNELGNLGASSPAFQNSFVYLGLALTLILFRLIKGRMPASKEVIKDADVTAAPIPWWYYGAFAVIDVEANYFVVLAFRYANFATVGLLMNLTTPFATLLSYVFLKKRFRWNHYIGGIIALCGCIVIFAFEYSSKNNIDELKGNCFVVLATIFYATSNVMEEWCVSDRGNTIEVNINFLGRMGMIGVVVSLIQILATERSDLSGIEWDGKIVALFAGYAIVLYVFYLVCSVFLRLVEAVFFNLSTITGTCYTVIASYVVFNESVAWYYWIALAANLCGIILYSFGEPVEKRDKVTREQSLPYASVTSMSSPKC